MAPSLHSFIKEFLNASNSGEIETLTAELDKVKEEKAALEKELNELKVCTRDNC